MGGVRALSRRGQAEERRDLGLGLWRMCKSSLQGKVLQVEERAYKWPEARSTVFWRTAWDSKRHIHVVNVCLASTLHQA